jgi:hypothetical protein
LQKRGEVIGVIDTPPEVALQVITDVNNFKDFMPRTLKSMAVRTEKLPGFNDFNPPDKSFATLPQREGAFGFPRPIFTEGIMVLWLSLKLELRDNSIKLYKKKFLWYFSLKRKILLVTVPPL